MYIMTCVIALGQNFFINLNLVVTYKFRVVQVHILLSRAFHCLPYNTNLAHMYGKAATI